MQRRFPSRSSRCTRVHTKRAKENFLIGTDDDDDDDDGILYIQRSCCLRFKKANRRVINWKSAWRRRKRNAALADLWCLRETTKSRDRVNAGGEWIKTPRSHSTFLLLSTVTGVRNFRRAKNTTINIYSNVENPRLTTSRRQQSIPFPPPHLHPPLLLLFGMPPKHKYCTGHDVRFGFEKVFGKRVGEATTTKRSFIENSKKKTVHSNPRSKV